MLSKQQEIILKSSKEILFGEKQLSFSDHFGKGFSERCIETPWVAMHLRGCQKLLDIGFTFASFEYLGLLLAFKQKLGGELKAADIINPEKVKTRYPKDWLGSILDVPVYVGDIRYLELPQNNYYDVVTCVSTIEHIGFDEPAKTVSNSAFERKHDQKEVNIKRDPDTNRVVLDSIHKILKKKGKILISTPMGKGGPVLLKDSLGLYCIQWEYNEESWQQITNHQGYELEEERFFKLTEEGWLEVPSAKELSRQSSYLKPHAEGCALCSLIKK